MTLSVATSRAGDLFGQPADALGVTNSATNVMPQMGGAAAAPPGAEEGWLAGLHISGFGSQTFGMWQNPTALRAFTKSRNNLAVARSLLQIDENYRLNENNSFFMREWFVYEPPYSWDSANIKQFESAQSPFVPRSYGHLINDYYNNYQVRDAWWENKTGPLTTFLGNQIVVWGQSVAFRVGDVINPADTCWAFGFANLEQSREAQWMIHPILNLPEWGSFTSNFLELVVQPGFQPRWWPEQTGDPADRARDMLTAGRVVPCQPSASHGPSARFDVGYPTEAKFGFDAPLGVGLYQSGGAQGTIPGRVPMVDQPVARLFWLCAGFSAAVRPGFNPYPPAFRGHFPCRTTLNKHQGVYSVIGDGTLADVGFFPIPGMQPENWNEGVRFHTLYGATEWTALYYYDRTDNGIAPALIWQHPFTNLWRLDYPTIQEAAITVDRPIPAPPSITEFFPAVFRGEVAYSNHNEFTDANLLSMTAIRFSDTVKYMLAIDVDQAYAPWLTTTGNLTVNLEVLHSIILDSSKTCSTTAFDTHCLKNDVNVLLNVATSWWWSDFAPNFAIIFNPKGRNMAMFPSLTLNPPWTKKYFLKLQAIEVMGGDKNAVPTVGLFKGQSYLIAQFQYNFNVM